MLVLVKSDNKIKTLCLHFQKDLAISFHWLRATGVPTEPNESTSNIFLFSKNASKPLKRIFVYSNTA